MTNKGEKTLIGAFVLGAIAIILVMLALLGSGQFLKSSFEFVCYFPGSLKGLSVGSPVYLSGVRIGAVTSITIAPNLDDSHSRPVTISLEKEKIFVSETSTFFDQDDANIIVANYIKDGLRAQLGTQSLLTGQLAVDLHFIKAEGTPPPHLVYHDDVLEIPTIESQMEAVLKAFSDIPFNKLTSSLIEVLDEADKTLKVVQSTIEESDIPSLISSYTLLAENIDSKFGELSSIRNEASVLIENINTLAVSTNELINNNEDSITSLITSMGNTSKKLGIFISDLDNLLAADSTTILQLDQTLHAIQAACIAVEQFAQLLEIRPDALIFGR